MATGIEQSIEGLDRERLEIQGQQANLHRKRAGIEDNPGLKGQDDKALKETHQQIESLEKQRLEILKRMQDLATQRRQEAEKEAKEQEANRLKEGRSIQNTAAGVATKSAKVQG